MSDLAAKGAISMTPAGAHLEIKIDGVVRTHRDERDTAIEAARFLQSRGQDPYH
jgi:hypothetical protein